MALRNLHNAITRRRLLGAGAGLAAFAAAFALHRAYLGSGTTPPLGFNLAAWQEDTNTNAAPWRQAIEDIHAFGVRRVTLVPYWFVDPRSGTVSATSAKDQPAGPSSTVLTETIKIGVDLGMDIAMKPLVEIDTASDFGHQWRGDLEFEGAAQIRFFTQYRDYIEEMAQLCVEHGATKLYLGSEMAAMTRQSSSRPHWDDLIGSLNRTYRSGDRKLSYAANYDEFESIWFWQHLDDIAVDAYFPLATKHQATGRGNPSVDILRSRWKRELREFSNLSRKLDLPVTISEFGIVPFDLASTQPWNWAKPIVSDEAPDEDPQEMLNAIEALLDVTRDYGDWLSGIDFWHWRVPNSEGSVYNIDGNTAAGQLIARYIR